MELPVSASEIDTRFCKQKIGILGAPGIGKSSFLSQDENALFLDLEGGLNFLKVKKLEIRSWNDLQEACVALQKAKIAGKLNYDMIVIDPIDRLLELAEEETISKAKSFYKNGADINVIADIPEGKGWDSRRSLTIKCLHFLAKLDIAVAYVSHLEIKQIEEDTRKYHKSTISIGGKVGGDLLAWTDHTIHVQAQLVGDKLIRTVFTIPTQSKEAKSRGGMVPNGWRWSENDKENWLKFRSFFK